MINILKEVYKKLHIIQNIYIKNKFFLKKNSYSMESEDLEIINILKNINDGFYVDVGGYHPLDRNNTYLLYKKNWRGINIDLSEFSIDLFNFARPDDINLNVAITNADGYVTYFYQKKLSQLSTIKKNIARQRMQGNISEKEVKSNKLTTIINNSKFKNRKIDFLNIDIEGADYEALKSLDFKIYRPKLICVEIYGEDIEQSEIYLFLKKLNYTKKWSATFSHLFTDDLYEF
ncbi:MAG: FkbM family methyltransferase [Candidatus Pelagibacter sp.]